jgi:hypothetical protein
MSLHLSSFFCTTHWARALRVSAAFLEALRGRQAVPRGNTKAGGQEAPSAYLGPDVVPTAKQSLAPQLSFRPCPKKELQAFAPSLPTAPFCSRRDRPPPAFFLCEIISFFSFAGYFWYFATRRICRPPGGHPVSAATAPAKDSPVSPT